MITQAQKDFFKSLYGYDEETQEEGSEIDAILETALIMPTQIIEYLNKAITEDCQTFLESLDQLYAHCRAQGHNDEKSLELIRPLKRLHDVCFNNDMLFEMEAADSPGRTNYGSEPTLRRVFGRLDAQAGMQDRIADITAEDAAEFQRMMVSAVANAIARLNARPQALNTRWRALVGLPQAQLPPALREASYDRSTSGGAVRHRSERHRDAHTPMFHRQRQAAHRRVHSDLPTQQQPLARRARIVMPLGEYLSAHYTDQITGTLAMKQAVYRQGTALAYQIAALDTISQANELAPTCSGGLPLRIENLIDSHEQADAYVVVAPPAEATNITTLPDYLRSADLQRQAQLAMATKQFLAELIAWEETRQAAETYLPIEPKLLIVSTGSQGGVALYRVGFVMTPAFLEYQMRLELDCSPLSAMLMSEEVARDAGYTATSSAFSLGMSLLFSCLSEAELFALLTTHMRSPMNKDTVNAFQLMMYPLVAGADLPALLTEKVAAGTLESGLAAILRATLVRDPVLRETNIRALLTESAPRLRPTAF